MSIQDLSEYLDFLDVERGLSQNTIDAYRRDLEMFIEFCLTKFSVDEKNISRLIVNAYLRDLHENHYNPTSISRKIQCIILQCFIKIAYNIENLRYNQFCCYGVIKYS